MIPNCVVSAYRFTSLQFAFHALSFALLSDFLKRFIKWKFVINRCCCARPTDQSVTHQLKSRHILSGNLRGAFLLVNVKRKRRGNVDVNGFEILWFSTSTFMNFELKMQRHKIKIDYWKGITVTFFWFLLSLFISTKSII